MTGDAWQKVTGDAWQEYVAGTQRLDAVRRGAVAASTEQERTLHAARQELAAVQARLGPQRARLRELGVPDDQLAPDPADLAAATQQTGYGLVSVVATLRRARAAADAADATVAGDAGRGSASPWLRNLLVYGPFSTVVLVVQLALYLAVGSSPSLYSALCGLAMPAAAFGLGWLVVGLVFPPEHTGRVERTPLVGVLVCSAPVLVLCSTAGVLGLLR